jgi:hypothetical protein
MTKVHPDAPVGMCGEFQSTGQRGQAVVDELLRYLVALIVRQLEQGWSTQTLLQLLLA